MKQENILFDQMGLENKNKFLEILKSEIIELEPFVMPFLEGLSKYNNYLMLSKKQLIGLFDSNSQHTLTFKEHKRNSGNWEELSFESSVKGNEVKGEYSYLFNDIEKTFKVGDEFHNDLSLTITKNNKEYKIKINSCDGRRHMDCEKSLTFYISKSV